MKIKSHLGHTVSFPNIGVTVPHFRHGIHGHPAPQSEVELTDEQAKGLLTDELAKGMLENGSLEIIDRPKGKGV